ncbi:aminoglycoside N3'-acetyltransferase [Rhizobium leguminosarum]|uniref:hypothetical protein n=1 Tax=Rhizobium leguminosarum TaxID=384 RepID=UPI001EC8621F|nr:hypothetical protein [Rhizobium leguminosarum]MBP2486411.1 aminoglycoside N3'-acetyltransferase [Rhizobium leguminosarum]
MIVPRFHTRFTLAKDLDNLGISAGDMVMVHAAMKRVGAAAQWSGCTDRCAS